MRFLIAVMLLALVSSACTTSEGSQTSNAYLQSFPTLKVEKMDLVSYSGFPASVIGISNIDIRAKVSGYVQKVYVDEGQEVNKGQLLFKLETETLDQNANSAYAAIEAAQVEVDRLKPLVEEDIISSVQLKAAEASLAQAKSNYASILSDIEYTEIKSPVKGVVGEIRNREGTLVSPSSTEALTTVSSIDDVYVYFSMNEKKFLHFTKDLNGETLEEKIQYLPNVKLKLADKSMYEHEGKIETITGDINKLTGSVQFRAKFPNPRKVLRNGSSGEVMIPTQYNQVLTIPLMSTGEMQHKKYVYQVTAQDSLERSIVDLGEIVDNYVIVNKGLDEGDIIIGKGMNKARPGMKIEKVPTTSKEVVESFDQVFQ
ncbi:efflux RND transporter periplasmic adaptor subunit [Aureibacter tunicatorum]|uniref:Membrane fusion protein (Multidrug efflux system) n=1 Tax=Aureibacter tunicatorum TaxID=866807 RepID=A0AAE4BTL4_9BACT|nr:efflux RND transporter periplasmic adaptor subunit [Aureibacter tunicatorum]MDR6240806.1 membrane fusion protein (multidrug efflux system) [Aureibacter tunicatorum]BDD06861.1 hemolysin D [Aureibacter tunicatorum]